jgi:hypothetical protein
MSIKARKKSKRNRRIMVSAAAIFLLLISIVAYISWLHRAPASKVPLQESSDYFSISNLGAICYTVGSNPAYNSTYYGPMVLIYDVAFNFTPVNGPAGDVRIFMSGNFNTEQADWEGTVIPQGTSTYSGELMPSAYIPSYRQSDGNYTMQVRIAADQADGEITLNFTAGINLVAAGPEPA